MGKKGPDAVRRSLCSRNYKTGGSVDSKEDPLIQIVRMHQHNINLAMLHTTRLFKIITEKNKADKEQHSNEDKRNMAREEEKQTLPT
jgi:hypothetical protein